MIKLLVVGVRFFVYCSFKANNKFGHDYSLLFIFPSILYCFVLL